MVLSRYLTLAIITLALPHGMWGAALYEQLPSPTVYWGGSYSTASQHIAEAVTPDSNWLVDAVRFDGFYSPSQNPPSVSFDVWFFSDNGGLPADSPFYSTSVVIAPTLTDPLPFLIQSQFTFYTPIPKVLLLAGEQYWFSVVSTSTELGDWGWLSNLDGVLEGETDLGIQAFRNINSSPPWQWRRSHRPGVFSLYGTANVPEPGTLLLAASSLALLFLCRRRSIS